MGDKKVRFGAGKRQIMEGMASAEQVDFTAFLGEAIGLGICCAEIALKNRSEGFGTVVYLGKPDKTSVEQDFVLDFTASEPTQPDVIDGVENPFHDIEALNLDFVEDIEQEVSRLVEALGATFETFVANSIRLRWHYGVLSANDQTMFVNDGNRSILQIDMEPPTS